MRAFVAVELPIPELPGIPRPTEAAPGHLTLLFLGEIPDAMAPALGVAFARAVAPQSAFELRLQGLGAFPSEERPRILFARIEEGARELAWLHDRLRDVAREHSIEVEARPFVPHLTLLRVRSPRDAALVRDLSASHGRAPVGAVRVTELLLKSSVLGRGGPVHRVEAHLPLAGADVGPG